MAGDERWRERENWLDILKISCYYGAQAMPRGRSSDRESSKTNADDALTMRGAGGECVMST